MKNDKFQENLSRPVIIDARARYRAAARRMRNTALYHMLKKSQSYTPEDGQKIARNILS